MKDQPSHYTGTADPVVLASGVGALLDANDALERRLVEAAKTVSTSFKLEVRQTGEKVYRYLDTLNGRLETFMSPKSLDKPKAKGELRQIVLKAETYVGQLAGELGSIRGLEFMKSALKQWSAQYLDFASQLGQSLGPDDLDDSGDTRVSKKAA